MVLIAALMSFWRPAYAVQSVRVSPDSDAIDLTRAVERYSAQGDRIQVSTAPGADGIVRRIEVSALEPGAQPAWIVFALTNDSEEQLTRVIVAPHFRFVGSGLVWPDLGSSRITTITASQGAAPEREDNAESDVFRLTLDPGTTVTYVAELRTPNLPQLYLWEPDAFKDKSTSLTLYEGILIGIAGLLALFLTIVFVVRGAMIFPAAAALAWAVFAYVCIDFGFWRKMFGLEDASERIWRAGVEATIGATLIVFLFAYLNLRRWHVRYTHFAVAWLLLMAAVVGLAVYNPQIAAGVARISIATVAGIGFLLILSLAARGSDRAVMLIPTWYLLAVWVVAAGAAALGYLTNDLAAPGLVGGLVLIVMLIGFTVMQFAFSGSGGRMDSGPDAERRSLAMTGSGEAIFDWNVLTDEVNGSELIEGQLGLKRGALEGPAAGWLDVLHPLDRDRYTVRARRASASALRADQSRSATARIGRALFLVRLKSTTCYQRRRRGRACDRLVVGRDRAQVGRGAHAPRRSSRQSDRPSQPRALQRSAGRSDPPGSEAWRQRADGDGDRCRRIPRGQRFLRAVDRRLDPLGGGSTSGAGSAAGRHPGSPGRRYVRRHRARRTCVFGCAGQDRRPALRRRRPDQLRRK